MNEFLQSGQHLDADQVSALVDHALPPHEREAVLAHLAICGECRETVALVSPPMEVAPTKDVREKYSRWFFNLKVLAPIAAAGFAAILLYVHFSGNSPARPSGPEPQIAQKMPAAPIVATNEPPAGVNRMKERPREANPGSKQAVAPTGRNAPALQTMSELGTAQGSAGSQFMSANQLTTPAAIPQPKSAPAQQAMGGLSGAQNEVGAGLTSGAPAAVPAPVPQQIAAQVGISQESAAHTDTLTSKDIDTLALEGRDTTELLKVLPGFVTASHLPGGAVPISSVTRGKQVLAIGARNKVYLSNDGGVTWIRVRVPWKSRAMKAGVVSDSAAKPKEQFAEARGEIMDGAPTRIAAPAPATAAPPPAAAQNLPAARPGSLVGTVTDTTGGVIPNATVNVTNSATRATQVTKTDANGQYRIDGLAPGNYNIKTTARGFEAFVSSVQVASTQVNMANFALSVGAETLTVTVSASEEMIPITPPTSNETIAGEAGTPAIGLQASTQATPLFQITTKNGEQWTSADGLTWQRK